ncbi:hypothetical protein HGM15179_012168 [Zosterops borbonicus]|uniref:Uncharacterized protein n=1 Tax=Zosterops borbonicus TaxID=364589 RepID=A0A8K1GBU8_9PASS|nr:hypothetical protein HGM15179_012168 [Zosterops borbonicus]
MSEFSSECPHIEHQALFEILKFGVMRLSQRPSVRIFGKLTLVPSTACKTCFLWDHEKEPICEGYKARVKVCPGHYVLVTNDTKINFIAPQTAPTMSLHERFTVDLWTEVCLSPGESFVSPP